MDRICSWFSFSFQIGRKLPPGSLFVDANFPWGWGLGGGPWTGVLRPGAMLPNLACISSKGGFGLCLPFSSPEFGYLLFFGLGGPGEGYA